MIKYFGTVVDNKLSWTFHTDFVRNKIASPKQFQSFNLLQSTSDLIRLFRTGSFAHLFWVSCCICKYVCRKHKQNISYAKEWY